MSTVATNGGHDVEALLADRRRLDWVLEIVTAGPECDRRTAALFVALLQGKTGREALDAAMGTGAAV